jgi:hypothetical protein
MNYKTCTKCNLVKEETNEYFGFHKGKLKARCKRCIADEQKEYRIKNSESVKATSKKSRLKNREKYLAAAKLKRKTCPQRQALLKKHQDKRLEKLKEHGPEWQAYLKLQKKYRAKAEVKKKNSIRAKKYRENNQEYFKNLSKKHITAATNCYINTLLSIACKQKGITKPEKFSHTLIELRRNQLILNRWVKENS